MSDKQPRCPHCGVVLANSEIAKIMRSIPSEARTKASRENGKKGGRPRKRDDS